MTGYITMYDAIEVSEIPLGATAVAGYTGGRWPTFDHLVSAYPRAERLSIAVTASEDAECLDIENGDAVPGDAPGWIARQEARGVKRPVLYASAFELAQEVLPVLGAAGIARSSVRLWSAHYGDGRHICGPSSCALMPVPADGTQWTDSALGRPLDESVLLPDFFGTPVPPKDWTYGAPLRLTATGGHESVRLDWQPPAGAPVPPAAYSVDVYQGTVCDRATLVHSYPRMVEMSLEFQGGSLQQGRTYTAHVVAEGPDGTRVRKYCYASVMFRTG